MWSAINMASASQAEALAVTPAILINRLEAEIAKYAVSLPFSVAAVTSSRLTGEERLAILTWEKHMDIKLAINTAE